MADWKSPMRADPSEWLVLNAAAPIKLRLLTELHALSPLDPNVHRLHQEVLKWVIVGPQQEGRVAQAGY